MIRTYEDSDVRYTYRDALVESLRNTGELKVGQLHLLMSKSLGFCWGVDRALAMVKDACREYPNRPKWLLSSLIHNPTVNEDMLKLGIGFLHGPYAVQGAYEDLSEKDVVIVPAFSARVEDMEILRARNVTLVDTTCPWVIKPHKRAQRYIKEGFTTVIHGMVGHDETLSTCSLVENSGGQYLVVHDKMETQSLAAFLRGDLSGKVLMKWLHQDATLPGFDPDVHLKKVGIINQTTMLATESREIGDIIQSALLQRDGEEELQDSFRDFDTICRATQDNQDAATEAVEGNPDLFLVVGGYDSSNTKNLARVGDDRNIPSYHIEGVECLQGAITHRDRATGEILQTADWLPSARPLKIAFSAGASTPDTILGAVVRHVAELVGESLPVFKEPTPKA